MVEATAVDSIAQFKLLKSDLFSHKMALSHALHDQHDHILWLYNIDFSVLFPYLVGENRVKNGRGRMNKEYDDLSLTTLKLIETYKHAVNFRIIVSDLAFYELLDHLAHKCEHTERMASTRESASRLFDTLKSYQQTSAEAIDTQEDVNFQRAEQMARRLGDILTFLPPGDDEREATEQLIGLIKDRSVSSLRHFYSTSDLGQAKNGGRMYNRALRSIDAYRSSAARVKAPEDEQFHREVDAWMVTLSRQLHDVHSNKHKLTFVGPNGLRNFYEHNIDQFSRPILAPYAVLRAFEQADATKDRKSEVKARLRKSLQRINDALEDVKRAGSFKALASSEIDNILHAREQLSEWLYTREDAEIRRRRQYERMEKLMKSPTHLRDKMKQSSEQAKKGARQLVELVPELLGEDLLESYDLQRNERVRMVMKKLDLK